MQTYDVIMLAVLVGCTVFGAWKGMAWQLASLGSLIASYFVALQFADRLAPHLGVEAPLNRWAAMLVLYLGSSLGIWLLFRIVSNAIDRVKLNEFDRQVGALFGLAKGILLCVVITFFAVTLSQAAREQILHSRSGHYIAELIDKADPVMPEGIHDVLGPYLHQLDSQLDPNYSAKDGHRAGVDHDDSPADVDSDWDRLRAAEQAYRNFRDAVDDPNDGSQRRR